MTDTLRQIPTLDAMSQPLVRSGQLSRKSSGLLLYCHSFGICSLICERKTSSPTMKGMLYVLTTLCGNLQERIAQRICSCMRTCRTSLTGDAILRTTISFIVLPFFILPTLFYLLLHTRAFSYAGCKEINRQGKRCHTHDVHLRRAHCRDVRP